MFIILISYIILNWVNFTHAIENPILYLEKVETGKREYPLTPTDTEKIVFNVSTCCIFQFSKSEPFTYLFATLKNIEKCKPPTATTPKCPCMPFIQYYTKSLNFTLDFVIGVANYYRELALDILFLFPDHIVFHRFLCSLFSWTTYYVNPNTEFSENICCIDS
jgi:hypothetical protein